MKAYTYLGQGKAALLDKPEPQLQGPRDALVTSRSRSCRGRVMPWCG